MYLAQSQSSANRLHRLRLDPELNRVVMTRPSRGLDVRLMGVGSLRRSDLLWDRVHVQSGNIQGQYSDINRK
jgi:hypothetical protein